jgi:hypothetical protein
MININISQAKKGVAVLGLVIIMIIAASALHLLPSSLIPGNSACDKVKNSILSEEKIGKILWNDYQNNWQYHIKNPNDSTNNSSLINSLIDVFQSDQKVYNFAYREAECFTPTKNAYVRTQETTTALIIKNLKTWINTGRVFDQDFYPQYSSFYDEANPSPSTTFHGTSV